MSQPGSALSIILGHMSSPIMDHYTPNNYTRQPIMLSQMLPSYCKVYWVNFHYCHSFHSTTGTYAALRTGTQLHWHVRSITGNGDKAKQNLLRTVQIVTFSWSEGSMQQWSSCSSQFVSLIGHNIFYCHWESS